MHSRHISSNQCDTTYSRDSGRLDVRRQCETLPQWRFQEPALFRTMHKGRRSREGCHSWAWALLLHLSLLRTLLYNNYLMDSSFTFLAWKMCLEVKEETMASIYSGLPTETQGDLGSHVDVVEINITSRRNEVSSVLPFYSPKWSTTQVYMTQFWAQKALDKKAPKPPTVLTTLSCQTPNPRGCQSRVLLLNRLIDFINTYYRQLPTDTVVKRDWTQLR